MAQFPCPSCSVLMPSDKLTCSTCGYRLKVDKTETGSHGVEEELRIPNWMIEEASSKARKKRAWGRSKKSQGKARRTISEIGSKASYEALGHQFTQPVAVPDEVTYERKRLYNAYAFIFVMSSLLLSYLFRIPLSKHPQVLPNTLLGLCCAVTFVGMKSPRLNQAMLFKPMKVWQSGQGYRFLSAGLAHLNLTHLLLNGFALYNFGPYLLSFLIGQFGFIAPCLFLGFFYFVVVLADVPDLIRHRKNPAYSSVGASGGIAGIIAASAIAYPGVRISFGYSSGGGGINAPVYIAGYLLVSLVLALRRRGKIAHLAHAAGTIAGLIIMLLVSNLRGLELYQHLLPPNMSAITSTAVANTSLLNRLSAASGGNWATESSAGSETSNILNIFSKDSCVVWDFPTEVDAQNAMKSDDWNGLTRYATDIDATTYVVLRAPDASTPCAQEARSAMGWGPLN